MAVTYDVQVTSFGLAGVHRELKTDAMSEVAGFVDELSHGAGVAFIAALKSGTDYGNFYLFRNEDGRVHIMLHEHREHFARDPAFQVAGEMAIFRGEDGEEFSVSAAQTTSWERGKAALLHWLPAQERWPELTWD